MRPDARAVARDALLRIDEGAYANLALPAMLERSGLSDRDRRFATELVYGTTRMRRAGDFLVDRFVLRPLDPPTRAVLRLGAHQLHHLGTPAHAAVSATVAVAPPRARGLVNAVLRRVADAPVEWPDDATRLSYPDWVVARLVEDLGEGDALAALEEMDRPAEPVQRADRVLVAAADGRWAPWRAQSLDRVLVDAPCSGLGVLRRRPDARWRIEPGAVGRLAGLQRELVDAAVALLRPGGTLTYPVCTLTAEETVGVDAWLAGAHPSLEPLAPPGDPWRSSGRGALLLPQAASTDGMFL